MLTENQKVIIEFIAKDWLLFSVRHSRHKDNEELKKYIREELSYEDSILAATQENYLTEREKRLSFSDRHKAIDNAETVLEPFLHMRFSTVVGGAINRHSSKVVGKAAGAAAGKVGGKALARRLALQKLKAAADVTVKKEFERKLKSGVSKKAAREAEKIARKALYSKAAVSVGKASFLKKSRGVAGAAAGGALKFGGTLVGSTVAGMAVSWGIELLGKVIFLKLKRMTDKCRQTAVRKNKGSVLFNSKQAKYKIIVDSTKCRIQAMKIIIRQLESEKSSCKNTENPNRCMSGLSSQAAKMYKQVANESDRMKKYQEKLNDYMRERPISMTSKPPEPGGLVK